MLTITKTLLSAAFIGAAVVRGQVTLDADASLGNSAVCPVPASPDVAAGVLAVVQFEEVATAELLGAELASAEVSLNVCLCVQAAVGTNLVDLPVDLQADARAAIVAEVAVSTDPLIAAVNNVLGTTAGSVLDVTLAPQGEVVGTCECRPTFIPTCANGRCGCDPCPAEQVFDPTLNACAACPDGFVFSEAAQNCVAVVPAPGASQALRRTRRSDPAISKRQATRQSVMERMRR